MLVRATRYTLRAVQFFGVENCPNIFEEII